jgi:hypothetical protein
MATAKPIAKKAINKFNSVNGFSVGMPARDIIDNTGNITAVNIASEGTITAPTIYGNVIGTINGYTLPTTIATVSPTAPPKPDYGELWFNSRQDELMIYLGMPIQWQSLKAGSGSKITRFKFDASTQWVVKHDKNTTLFQESVVDSNGRRFYPGIQIVDNNTFVINMTEATAGYVDVVFN